MGLFRNRSIVEVVEKLGLALPDASRAFVARSSIPEARARVGPEPLAWLLHQVGVEWGLASAERYSYRGLKLLGVDGLEVRVPDSKENRGHFGGHDNGKRESGYPLCRLVALMALGSHLILDASFGPVSKGELTLMKPLWDVIPDDSLCIADQLYANPATMLPYVQAGSNRHFLSRAPARMKMKLVEVIGRSDELVEVEVDREARKKNPDLPERVQLRVIYYRRKGFPVGQLITTLLNPVLYPAQEIIGLYHKRWELELGYDELKTELLDRAVTLRSQKPEGVEQELWGILLAYNLVRREMEKVAEEAKVEPTRISFVMSLRLIQDEILWCAIASPGAIPRHLANLRRELKRYILPPRRSERAYPRAVKIQPRKYAARA
jgi:hypothetical protein